MKNTKYNTVKTVLKYNRTFVERVKIVGGVKIDTTNTQIHDQSQFVSDLLQVDGFAWVLRYPPPINLTAPV